MLVSDQKIFYLSFMSYKYHWAMRYAHVCPSHFCLHENFHAIRIFLFSDFLESKPLQLPNIIYVNYFIFVTRGSPYVSEFTII